MTEYEKYANVCRECLTDDTVFNSFKQNWNYTYMLEQHWEGTEFLGKQYVQTLKTKYGDKLAFLPWGKYRENDNLGSPRKTEYLELEECVTLGDYFFSHTTLRYILFSLDIITFLTVKYRSVPSKLNIVEIGGGYGGQCKILLDTLHYATDSYNFTYTIIDLDFVSKMQAKYLDKIKTKNVFCYNTDEYKEKCGDTKFDFCLSTYAIGEISKEFQDQYIKDIILKCESAYMVWNATGINPLFDADIKLSVTDEEPLITRGNKVVTF